MGGLRHEPDTLPSSGVQLYSGPRAGTGGGFWHREKEAGVLGREARCAEAGWRAGVLPATPYLDACSAGGVRAEAS